MGKMRTLEMEVHFSYVPEAAPDDWRRMDEKSRLERQVRVLERLSEHFVASGSTIEVYREDWQPEKDCPLSNLCGEPPVHVPSMSLNQFACSFVNRKLLPG